MGIERRLADMGLTLPSAPRPRANYCPFVITGDLVFVSGQLPLEGQTLMTGKLGRDLEIAEGAKAARLCAINMLAQVKSACNGNLERLAGVVKLTGFVNATDSFADHPAVINGASDFLIDVLGPTGVHARSAVGVASLPLDAAVEVEGIFSIGTD